MSVQRTTAAMTQCMWTQGWFLCRRGRDVWWLSPQRSLFIPFLPSMITTRKCAKKMVMLRLVAWGTWLAPRIIILHSLSLCKQNWQNAPRALWSNLHICEQPALHAFLPRGCPSPLLISGKRPDAGTGPLSIMHCISSFTPVMWHVWNEPACQWGECPAAFRDVEGTCWSLQISHRCTGVWHLIFKPNYRLCTQRIKLGNSTQTDGLSIQTSSVKTHLRAFCHKWSQSRERKRERDGDWKEQSHGENK